MGPTVSSNLPWDFSMDREPQFPHAPVFTQTLHQDERMGPDELEHHFFLTSLARGVDYSISSNAPDRGQPGGVSQAVGSVSTPSRDTPAPVLRYRSDKCHGNSISRDVDKEKSWIASFSLFISFIRAMSSFLARREEKSHYNVHGTENSSETFLQVWKGAAHSVRKCLLPWMGKVPVEELWGWLVPWDKTASKARGHCGMLRTAATKHWYLWICAARDDSWLFRLPQLTSQKTMCFGLVLLLSYHLLPLRCKGFYPCQQGGSSSPGLAGGRGNESLHYPKQRSWISFTLPQVLTTFPALIVIISISYIYSLIKTAIQHLFLAQRNEELCNFIQLSQ